MAGPSLGPPVLGAAIALGTTLYNNERAFSGRHEQNYDSQVALTQRIVEGFTKAHRDGEVEDEDHETFIRLRDEAIDSAKHYSKTILDYKSVPTYNIPSKVRRKKQVRMSKRELRQVNEQLQSHYCSSLSSFGSDTSSIAAQSGSPPGSGLENERIRDWTYDVRSCQSRTSLDGEHPSDDEIGWVGWAEVKAEGAVDGSPESGMSLGRQSASADLVTDGPYLCPMVPHASAIQLGDVNIHKKRQQRKKKLNKYKNNAEKILSLFSSPKAGRLQDGHSNSYGSVHKQSN